MCRYRYHVDTMLQLCISSLGVHLFLLSARLAADVTKMLLSAHITVCVCERAKSMLCLLARLHCSSGFASCILANHPDAPALLTGELQEQSDAAVSID